jgi:hypothetical protein
MTDQLPERRSALPDRWEPLRELEQMTGRMRHMLDERFGGFAWPVLRRTRRTGRFAHHVAIPSRVDPDKIEASLADGVLTSRRRREAHLDRFPRAPRPC